jgi:hypothetical protein
LTMVAVGRALDSPPSYAVNAGELTSLRIAGPDPALTPSIRFPAWQCPSRFLQNFFREP